MPWRCGRHGRPTRWAMPRGVEGVTAPGPRERSGGGRRGSTGQHRPRSDTCNTRCHATRSAPLACLAHQALAGAAGAIGGAAADTRGRPGATGNDTDNHRSVWCGLGRQDARPGGQAPWHPPCFLAARSQQWLVAHRGGVFRRREACVLCLACMNTVDGAAKDAQGICNSCLGKDLEELARMLGPSAFITVACTSGRTVRSSHTQRASAAGRGRHATWEDGRLPSARRGDPGGTGVQHARVVCPLRARCNSVSSLVSATLGMWFTMAASGLGLDAAPADLAGTCR